MSPSSSSTRIRWWPLVVLLVLVAAYLSWAWMTPAPSTQDKVIRTIPAVFFGPLLLLFWLFLFSRLPGRLRLKLFGGFVLLSAGFLALFKIDGVSGNLVPNLTPRWGGDRDYGSQADPSSAGVTAPGPGDYPQFNGPSRDGRVDDGPRLARDWDGQPPKEVWRHDIGEGWSAFVVVGDAAITQEQRETEELVVRYELTTGNTVWTHAYEAPFSSSLGGNGPRATPAIADGRVYALGATGVLSCLDLGSGEEIWSRNVVVEHQGAVPEWGVAGSPLIAGDLVVVQPGQVGDWDDVTKDWKNGLSLAAYRRDSGEPIWRAGGGQGSYSSPYLTTLAGVKQIVSVNQTDVSGYLPETGELLWTLPWPRLQPKVSMPLPIDENTLLVSAGYGVGSRLLRLTGEAAGAGSLTASEVWSSPRLKSKFANMVLHNGTIYGLDDGVLTAIDPATGDRLWKHGRFGHGQLILSGDLLLVQTEKGPVVLVEANPEAFRELGRIPALSSQTWNAPALSGRYLLVRNNREAVCFELPVEG